jgi:hypothetical protein
MSAAFLIDGPDADADPPPANSFIEALKLAAPEVTISMSPPLILM